MFLSRYCNLEQKILASQYLAELKFRQGICVHFIFLQYTSNGLDIERHDYVCVSIVYVER